MDKILLIDGLNFIFRASVAFKPKIEDLDKPNNTIVFNFFRNLRALVEQFNPDKVFFVLEGTGKFRYDLYPKYKGNRIIKTASQQETRDDFHRQKREIIRLLSYLPITIVKSPDYECDDTIGTLVENLKDEDITVVSNDSDFIQLLQKGYKNLKIYNPMKKEFMIAPSYHYVVFKALKGDKSDNIDGLVSEKKAETYCNNPEDFKKFLSLEENWSNFSLNKQLIEIKILKDDDLNFIEYNIDFEKLKIEFQLMEFESIIKEPYWTKFKDTFSNLR